MERKVEKKHTNKISQCVSIELNKVDNWAARERKRASNIDAKSTHTHF